MTTPTTTTIGFCLQPLDVLFFRDGRPFMSGTEQMVSGLPLPQTLAGAIRTALLRAAGCHFAELAKAMKKGQGFKAAVRAACASEYHWLGDLCVRGPWLARRHADTGKLEVFVSAPAVLHRSKNEAAEKLWRLTPLPAGELPGWQPAEDQQGLRPLWSKERTVTEPAEGYLTPQGLHQFLRGEPVPRDEVISPDELFGFDFRTGIGINPDRLVAAESQIYGRGFLAFKEDFYQRSQVVLYAEVSVLEGVRVEPLLDHLRTIPLGGESRHVVIEWLEQPFSWPNVQPQGKKQKPLILLTTPCPFEAGWKPRILDGQFVAAAVPGSLAFSGWDLARGGPKPMRFAVPPGSVYFLESLPNNWRQSLAENEEDCLQGWGCCLTGVWTDE
jgi:CRISPR-associated protein Cmr3